MIHWQVLVFIFAGSITKQGLLNRKYAVWLTVSLK